MKKKEKVFQFGKNTDNWKKKNIQTHTLTHTHNPKNTFNI